MPNQFSRTELLIGKEAIEKLQNSKVAIFGIGGVGSYVAEGLARAGVGNFILVDNDNVSVSNINRQIIATHKTVGMAKVDIAKNRILEINPNANVVVYKEFFMPKTQGIIDNSVEYIVDAIDTVTAKIGLVVRANKMNIPIISCMGTGNKLDPTRFEISDIYKTSVCPLAKVMRKELKARGIKKLKVLYSKEEPIKIELLKNEEQQIKIDYSNTNSVMELSNSINGGIKITDSTKMGEDGKQNNKKQIPGSISFVPSVAGLIIAGEVVKDLII